VCTGRAGSDPRPRTTVPGRTQTGHHRPRTREASGEGCIYSSSVRVRSYGQRGRVPVRLPVRERRVMSPTGYHARRHQDAAAVSSVSGSPQPRSEGAHRTTTGRVNRGAWVRPGSGGGGPPPARRPARGAPARRHVRDRPGAGGIFSRQIFSTYFSRFPRLLLLLFRPLSSPPPSPGLISARRRRCPPAVAVPMVTL
jgi:hypothetical protein